MLHALPRCTPLGWRPACIYGPLRFVTPRLEAVRPFASRTRPRTIPAKGFARERPHWSRVKQIIFSTRQLLEQEKNEEAVTLFRDRLSQISSGRHTCRFGLYESGISTFLRHRRLKDAIELQDSMYKERMTPSSGLRAKMFVCSSIVKAPHQQQEELASLFSKLSRVLSLPSYSERSLRELLDIMKNHPLLDSHFVNRLVDDYVDSRESHPISDSDLGDDSRGSLYRLDVNTINKLILFYARVGSIDTAASLVFSHQDSSDNQPRPANAGPYTTLLSELTRSTHPLSTKRLNLLLDKMSQSQIQIDLPLLNSLVQLAVRQDKFHQAFALYNRILKDSAPHMIPDSFAFGSLFNALQRIWTTTKPTALRARHLLDVPTPRQLFRQMLECHMLSTRTSDPRTHPVTRVSTLNVALRLFMLAMDYPAALVTLRTFRELGLYPDARSYRFVLTILLAHVKMGLQAPDEAHHHVSRWAISFLGGPERAAHTLPELITVEDTGALLNSAVADDKDRFRVPSVAAILGREGTPRNAEWDLEPLERLLAKAVVSTTTASVMERRAFRHLLRTTLNPVYYEMVPRGLWRGRRAPRPTS